jgi:hypothetical protein
MRLAHWASAQMPHEMQYFRGRRADAFTNISPNIAKVGTANTVL